MSYMSELDIELQILQDAAMDAAQELADKLQAISDLHWQDQVDAPLFRATQETLKLLRQIELTLACPIGEIECAA